MAPMLELKDVRTAYGSIEALKGVSLTVEEGEVVTLIGSNGAGKSTTLRSISGLTPPRTGSIKFRGEEISTVPAQEIVRLGISQSPEGRHCFQRMTVRENLELGAYLRRDANVKGDMDRVFDLFPRLKEREKQKAGTMSGGEQQMLAMGRALMADPALLLLDEPSMGLAPILVDRIYGALAALLLARVGDHRVVPVGPEGLRRARRAGERAAAQLHRRDHLAGRAAAPGLAVEEGRAVRPRREQDAARPDRAGERDGGVTP